MSYYSTRYPELFDPDDPEDDVTPEEMEKINKLTDAILSADTDFERWATALHAEAIAAQERDEHRECFGDEHFGCSLDPRTTEKAN